jgi:myosin protein heavy chain
LKRRDDDLIKAVTSNENDATTKAACQKQIRDFQTKLDDLQADMDSERESRKRLEREKRDWMEEIESLRNEVLDSADISQAMHDREKKREEELSTLKRVVDQTHKDRETAMVDLRSKHAKEIEEITNQFENAKRQLQAFAKDRQQQLNDAKDRENEIKNFNALKQEMERKRKQLEMQVQDLQHKFNESERIRNETFDKSQRCQQDIEALNAAFIEAEQRLQNNERAYNTLKQDNQELQENLQDENRQKMNSLSKLRQAEDLLNELKDQLDDKEEERHKIETKLMQIAQQNAELRRQAEHVNVEQIEELRRQLQREKEALLEEVDNGKAINSNLSKSNKKLTNDIADLSNELERYRTIVQNVEKQQRLYDKKVQDEKILQDKLRQERDQNEREIREKETQRLNLLKELDEKSFAYDELDKRYKQLRTQAENINRTTDDV